MWQLQEIYYNGRRVATSVTPTCTAEDVNMLRLIEIYASFFTEIVQVLWCCIIANCICRKTATVQLYRHVIALMGNGEDQRVQSLSLSLQYFVLKNTIEFMCKFLNSLKTFKKLTPRLKYLEVLLITSGHLAKSRYLLKQ